MMTMKTRGFGGPGGGFGGPGGPGGFGGPQMANMPDFDSDKYVEKRKS